MFSAEHNIEIPIQINIGGPGSRDTSIQDRRGQFCVRLNGEAVELNSSGHHPQIQQHLTESDRLNN